MRIHVWLLLLSMSLLLALLCWTFELEGMDTNKGSVRSSALTPNLIRLPCLETGMDRVCALVVLTLRMSNHEATEQ